MLNEMLTQAIEYERRRDSEGARLRHLLAAASQCCATARRSLLGRLRASVSVLLGRRRLAS